MKRRAEVVARAAQVAHQRALLDAFHATPVASVLPPREWTAEQWAERNEWYRVRFACGGERAGTAGRDQCGGGKGAAMTITFTFTVPIKPRSKERARSTKSGRHYTPASTRAAQHAIAWCAAGACPRDWPMDARYRLEVRFFGAHGNTDWDNAGKLVSDACTNILWNDDRQVDDGRAIRCVGGEPRFEVTVEVIA